MKLSKPIQGGLAVVCAAILAITPLWAKNRKGDHFYKLGIKAEADKNYDEAVEDFDQALASDGKEPSYVMAARRAHAAAAAYHVQQGRKLLGQQKLEEAMTQFQKAYLDDPGSQISIQLVRETTDMLKEKASSAPGTVILTPAEKAREAVEKRVNSLEGPPELKPLNDEIRSLKMNNQPSRVLFESVAKLAGINVIFDPQGIDTIGGKNFNLDLNNVTLEEALDYVALETHTFWQPISHNAIFVTQESEPKRAEYQDEVVRVFYIQNASSASEFGEIYNAIRIGAKITNGLFQVTGQNAIVARGTVATMAIIEKLVHDLDKPKPEVMVDVLVLEVNKTSTFTLGANLLGQGGLNVPVSFSPRSSIQVPTTGTTGTTGTTTATTTSTTGTTGTDATTGGIGTTGAVGTTGTTGTTTTSGASIPISNLGHLSSADFSTTLPGALLTAILSDSSAKILQRPQVRATDGGKATLHIGSKIPYVSGSLNSAVATPGAIPYATTQFQQIDVGVVVELQPHVNAPNDVSMHIKVDISNTNGSENIGGIDEPIITQRTNEADIRMKEGEVSILGGLTDLESALGVSGTPGLVNIPVLGYLFGQKNRTKSDDEILIALIPHIVRAPDVTEINGKAVYAGSDRVVNVHRSVDGAQDGGSMAPTDGKPGPQGYQVSPNAPTQQNPPPVQSSQQAQPTQPNQPAQLTPEQQAQQYRQQLEQRMRFQQQRQQNQNEQQPQGSDGQPNQYPPTLPRHATIPPSMPQQQGEPPPNQ